MRDKDEVLADFRQVVRELSAGRTSYETIKLLEQLTDEFSLLELELDGAGSIDPCRDIRQTIMLLKMSNPSPERLVQLSWELSHAIGRLSQMTRVASVGNSDDTGDAIRQ